MLHVLPAPMHLTVSPAIKVTTGLSLTVVSVQLVLQVAPPVIVQEYAIVVYQAIIFSRVTVWFALIIAQLVVMDRPAQLVLKVFWSQMHAYYAQILHIRDRQVALHAWLPIISSVAVYAGILIS